MEAVRKWVAETFGGQWWFVDRLRASILHRLQTVEQAKEMLDSSNRL